MYEQSKTTRNATWQTFYIVMATMHKLDLQSVFMAAVFGDKLKIQVNNILNHLSVNKATHENTLFFLAVF
jgi:hypothetical protein